MKKSSQKIITAVSFLFLVLALAVFVWEGIYVPMTPEFKETKIFSAEKGEGTKEISINLQEQGFIKYGFLFRIYALTRGVADKLQAGNYLLSPSMAMPEITKKLVSGDIVREKITIIEGWNIRDISFYLEEQGIVKAADFSTLVNSARDFSEDFDFLSSKPEILSLEGYLFPDTYEIQKGESTEELVRKILKNFGQKLTPELREEIKKQDKTIFEIITMASLIEKEVKTLEDKKMVSGVLWKRLENGMPLQVDATISYITGKKNAKVLIADTQIDSRYNTYKYLGLPRGPISNPGLESIVSAFSPENSQYWYYLSTPEGETIFSRTFEEHNKAQAEYLK
jgi:UPF0755 protein